jgi:hypothetical protein
MSATMKFTAKLFRGWATILLFGLVFIAGSGRWCVTLRIKAVGASRLALFRATGGVDIAALQARGL